MAHKLVGFAPSTNSSLTEYIKLQLQAIDNEFSDVSTEFADENDSRLTRYCNVPDQLPVLMLFKNDARKAHVHAKYSLSDAIDWVRRRKG